MSAPITPIAWTTLENAIQAFFVAASGLTVIWGNQAGPRPAYPYGTVSIISGPTPVGIDELRTVAADPPVAIPDEGGVLSAVGNRDITVSFQVFGPAGSVAPTAHARSYAAAVVAAFELPLYGDALKLAGVAIREIIPINLPDRQVADSWQSRAAVDVRFGIVSEVSQPIHVIESVEVNAEPGADDLGTLDPALIPDIEVP